MVPLWHSLYVAMVLCFKQAVSTSCLLQWTALRKVFMGFLTTPQLYWPATWPVLRQSSFGDRKHSSNCGNLNFPLLQFKISDCMWSISDQKLPAAKLFVLMFGRHQWNNFRIRCAFKHCTIIKWMHTLLPFTNTNTLLPFTNTNVRCFKQVVGPISQTAASICIMIGPRL